MRKPASLRTHFLVVVFLAILSLHSSPFNQLERQNFGKFIDWHNNLNLVMVKL